MDAVQVVDAFTQATIHVFTSMAHVSPEPGKAYMKKSSDACGVITGYVAAWDEDRQKKGSISLSVDREGAIFLAHAMLGEFVENEEEDARETVGELINILSGDARRRMAEQGVLFHGSTPQLIDGQGHKMIHDCKAPIVAIPFTLPQGCCTVEFCFELEIK